MYDMKALYEAYSVEEAIKLRLEHPEAQIIAGGTDVLVQMREGEGQRNSRHLHGRAGEYPHRLAHDLLPHHP